VQVISVNQDSTPQGFPIVDGDLTVWARNLTGGSIAVALYNAEDADVSIGVPSFEALGWPATQKAAGVGSGKQTAIHNLPNAFHNVYVTC
jgi:hypothetical protein